MISRSVEDSCGDLGARRDGLADRGLAPRRRASGRAGTRPRPCVSVPSSVEAVVVLEALDRGGRRPRPVVVDRHVVVRVVAERAQVALELADVVAVGHPRRRSRARRAARRTAATRPARRRRRRATARGATTAPGSRTAVSVPVAAGAPATPRRRSRACRRRCRGRRGRAARRSPSRCAAAAARAGRRRVVAAARPARPRRRRPAAPSTPAVVTRAPHGALRARACAAEAAGRLLLARLLRLLELRVLGIDPAARSIRICAPPFSSNCGSGKSMPCSRMQRDVGERRLAGTSSAAPRDISGGLTASRCLRHALSAASIFCRRDALGRRRAGCRAGPARVGHVDPVLAHALRELERGVLQLFCSRSGRRRRRRVLAAGGERERGHGQQRGERALGVRMWVRMAPNGAAARMRSGSASDRNRMRDRQRQPQQRAAAGRRLGARRVPPWRSATWRTIARPRPEPGAPARRGGAVEAVEDVREVARRRCRGRGRARSARRRAGAPRRSAPGGLQLRRVVEQVRDRAVEPRRARP